MNESTTAPQTDLATYQPHWQTIDSWGTARGGEFQWARACRRITTTTLVLGIAALFYLLRSGDPTGANPAWRAQVLLVCAALLLCCLAPSMLRAYYHHRFGSSVVTEDGNAISWL